MVQSIKYSPQKPVDLGSILHIRKTGMVMCCGVGVGVNAASLAQLVSLRPGRDPDLEHQGGLYLKDHTCG